MLLDYLESMLAALSRRGWTRADFERVLEKREAILSVTPAQEGRPMWVVDWVTTLPQFRKLGLISKLIDQTLLRGASSSTSSCHAAGKDSGW